MAIRADASTRIGGGHVMRCLTLAEMVSDGAPTTFLCCDVDGALFDLIEARGHRTVRLPGESAPWRDDADRSLLFLDERHFDWLVVDHYGLDSKWERAVRPAVDRLMVIDDLADRPHECDLLLDQTPGRRRADYRGLTPDACRHLFGPSHALVGAAFRERREPALLRRRLENGVNRILVSFGLMDDGTAAGIALTAIAASSVGAQARIDVVLNERATSAETLRRQADRLASSVHFHFSTTEMAGLMAGADLAIGAAGTTSWERCCVGLPALVLTTADNQALNAEALKKSGAAMILGKLGHVGPEDLAAALDAAVADPVAVADMARKAAALFDGNADVWLRTEMLPPERIRAGGAVRIRRATPDDGETLFHWQRLPETRRFSRNPEAPTHRGHLAWFAARLADHRCLFFVIEHDEEAAGVLRLDRRPGQDGFEVSVLVAPEKWGLGIGHAALRLACRAVPRHAFHAYVMAENKRSRTMFERAGYRPANDAWLVREPDAEERAL